MKNKKKKKINVKTPIKRKIESIKKEENKRQRHSHQQSLRTFANSNLQTCWLNSSIQLMLAVFDEEIREISVESSELWKCFLQYQAGTLSQDPNIIKNILFGNCH